MNPSWIHFGRLFAQALAAVFTLYLLSQPGAGRGAGNHSVGGGNAPFFLE